MWQDLPRPKDAVRLKVRESLAGLAVGKKARRSALACALLQRQAVWNNACSVLFYAPLPGELDVWPLLEMALKVGKIASLPRYSPASDAYIACQVHDPQTDVQPGRFGIREPVANCQEIELNGLDLVLVPGLAFDLHGRRLGRGKGYYDHLLRLVRGKTCGVAFDEQVVNEVPVEGHDVVLNCILTPTRWVQL